MNLHNYINYGMCIYNQNVSSKDAYKLGDVVINDDNEIGVIIQMHSPDEFRTDMFGNSSAIEVRLATDVEIALYRPNINDASFNHTEVVSLVKKLTKQ